MSASSHYSNETVLSHPTKQEAVKRMPVPSVMPIDTPFTITDNVCKFGWVSGVYAQDEWKVTDRFIINGGVRFDQMWLFTNANQLSPRTSFAYTPFEFTRFHFGNARYFTPPVLVEAAPANIALFNNTTVELELWPAIPREAQFARNVGQRRSLHCPSSEERGQRESPNSSGSVTGRSKPWA